MTSLFLRNAPSGHLCLPFPARWNQRNTEQVYSTVGIRWIWVQGRHRPPPSHAALAALSLKQQLTGQQQLCPQSRWHSSLLFVILTVGNRREPIHSDQAEDLSFLKRLPRVEVIFSLPSHTAFTACVYSKDKNHKHAKKALPDCSQRATMPRGWNAFRGAEKCT